MDEQGFAELCFDLGGSSVNKFNHQTLAELRTAVDKLKSAEGLAGLMITSGKQGFVVGADITEFTESFQRPPGEFKSEVFATNRLFSDIEDLPAPTVAVINGMTLGGGFELCLCCDYRVMSETAIAGLPEVSLGIFPGWGGTIRLPRLIGITDALDWITKGRSRKPAAALACGAVDAVVPPDELKSAACDILQRAQSGEFDFRSRREIKRRPVAMSAAGQEQLFASVEEKVVAASGPHYPAPLMALRAMRKHSLLSRDEAIPVEIAAFVETARTDTASSLIGLFLNRKFLKKELKTYTGAVHSVNRIGVLGAGIMGGGIAYQSAVKGVPVVMKDISTDALDSGINEAQKRLKSQVDGGRLTREKSRSVMARITPTLDFDEFATCDLVIEAVSENVRLKSDVLAELEHVVGADVTIASNTSTISIDQLSRSFINPERFCGIHFFDPVHVMPLVEVIRGSGSSNVAIATALNYFSSIGKNPVVVNDCPGFLVNRVLFPYLNAFELLLADGVEFARIDRVMESFGWPMGPAYLLDVVGIDTAVHAGGIMAEGFPDRMKLDFVTATEHLLKQGRLGQKSGSGYYRYEQSPGGKPEKLPDQLASSIVDKVRGRQFVVDEEDIIARMMVPMCIELTRCLEEGVVNSAAAADMGLIWGLGFPAHVGGALRYIDRLGAAAFCSLADRFKALGAAYEPTARLREMAAEGAQFFR